MAMNAVGLQVVFDLVMDRPRVITGAAEVTCLAYTPNAVERRQRLIDGIYPIGTGL